MLKLDAIKLGLLMAFHVVMGNLLAQPAGYSYGKQISLLSAKVSGSANLTNFPVLISVTDNNLRTTANGGHVTNVNGYDIVFTSSNCMTILQHQIESYNATTGNFIVWVKIPTLNVSGNTVIQMYYGKSTVSTDPSVNTVWDSNYKAVWHFNNSITDKTANGTVLTDNSTANFSGAQIGDGRDLDNSTNVLSSAAGKYLKLANGFFAGMTDFTFEGWVFLDRSDTNWERIYDFGQSTTINFFLCPSIANGSPASANTRITTGGNPTEQGPSSAAVTNTGSWIHWAVVLSSATSSMTLYKNGAALATASGSVSLRPSNMETSTANYFGRSQYGADHYIDAKFDEFRLSSSARSADWITTSYNNQSSPSTFYSITTEAAAASMCSALPVELTSFKAVQDGGKVAINWTTQSEHNNKSFAIERSTDGNEWESIGTISGKGTNLAQATYVFIDDKVKTSGRYYYRLYQEDYDGTGRYTATASVLFENNKIAVYTTADNKLIIETNDDAAFVIELYTELGAPVIVPEHQSLNGKTVYDAASLPAGVYLVKVHYNNHIFTQKIVLH